MSDWQSPGDGHQPRDGRRRRLETLLIGIDAACSEIVEPRLADGMLPNLQSILDAGVGTSLQSQVPPWTASAWPSLYTGVNPGKHGVYGFLDYDGYDWDVVDMTDVKELAIWEILNHHDRSSVVVNVPVTTPPDPFDGALIPGYTAPEEPRCHPRGILEEFESIHGQYRIYPDERRDPTAEYPDLVRMRGDAFAFLAERFEPDFGFIQFQVTDSVFHEHPGDSDLVDTIYQAVDDEVGRLLDQFNPRTVVVASDHGMGPYDNYEFRVNEFLEQSGYVTAAVGGDGMPAWLPILNESLKYGKSPSGGSATTTGRLIDAAARAGLTPERAGRVLRTLRLDGIVRSWLPQSAKRSGRRQVDFAESTAYMRSRIELGLRINLEGREPAGTVSEDAYEGVRDDLINLLSTVETPDGLPVFDDVSRSERYFWGPHTDDATDIVTVPRQFDEFLSADLKGSVFGEPTEPWNHKLNGLLLLCGDDISPLADIGTAHLFDVAPTVLASMGIPTSDRMDGWVLPPVSQVDSQTYPLPDRRGPDHEDRPEVEQRLEALGYIDGNP